MPDTKVEKRPTILAILDGFGLASPGKGNAITKDTAPHIFDWMHDWPSTRLTAHGEAVGLFTDQQGNSEAGHFTIGAGRIVKQDLKVISDAIHDGTFFKNEAFHQARKHAEKYDTVVHVMGLLTDDQSAHAKPEHLYALLDYFRTHETRPVYLHLFTDGRDSSPHGAVSFLKGLREHMSEGQQIATIGGRFYGMDRNKIWERTRRHYDAMTLGRGCTATSAEEAIQQAYNRGETDEYICPSIIVDEEGKPRATVQDNDVIYFFNARSDRARQITKAFVQPDFRTHNKNAFKRTRTPKNIRFVAMTDFGPDLPDILTAFPSADIPNSLPCAIDGAYKQLYISETEKYAHVTYFVNGGYADAICGEHRILVDSDAIKSYADEPAMKAELITDTVIDYLKKDRYNFITINYPNADMVGHTGDLDAAKKAVTALDNQLARLVEYTRSINGRIMITADHGNAEQMINSKTGEIMTEHTTNPVPFILIDEQLKKKRLTHGTLCDVAPTVLKLLGVEKPEEMTGTSLL